MYHKWHSPVDGTILAVYKLPGYYCVQNPCITDTTGKHENYCNSLPFLSCTSTRQVILVEADNKKIGKIFLIMVGMAEVSTCITHLKPGQRVHKGEYIG